LEYYGPVFEMEHADFEVDLNQEFKVDFDVASISASKTEANRKFVTVARYLQLHRAPDLENNHVKAVLVVHGSAIFDLFIHKEYATYHNEQGLKNPNYDLISVLDKEGVDVVLCGQSAKSRGITRRMLHPKVKLALSAMSVHLHLNKKDYTLIKL
jgi:intracellular sulfur oxidation DsrE/DsrF family protein